MVAGLVAIDNLPHRFQGVQALYRRLGFPVCLLVGVIGKRINAKSAPIEADKVTGLHGFYFFDLPDIQLSAVVSISKFIEGFLQMIEAGGEPILLASIGLLG